MAESSRSKLPPELAASGLAVVTGALLLHLGSTFKGMVSPISGPWALVTLWGFYVVGFACLVSAVTNISVVKHGYTLSYAALFVVTIAIILTSIARAEQSTFGTDAMLFAQYSTDLVLAGQNPYAHTMATAFEKYPVMESFVTYRVDGSIVASLSYPGLSVLYFLPQRLLGIPNLNLTSVALLLLTLVYLTVESPRVLALVPFVVMFTNQNLMHFSYGGVFDILWVLPLLIAMRFWYEDNFPFAAVFTGLSFAVKQTPWFIGPFLAVWLFMERDSWSQFLSKAQTCIGYGLLGFILPNLPFLVLDPGAWLKGVFTPVAGGSSLVMQGSGLVLLEVTNVLPVRKAFFVIMLFAVMGALLGIYTLFFDQLKWFAWIAPIVILFFHYRSLQNYFIFFIPISYYILLLRFDIVLPLQA